MYKVGGEYLNFICFMFDDIVMNKDKTKWGVYISKKAYCFEFGTNYYELLLNLSHAMF